MAIRKSEEQKLAELEEQKAQLVAERERLEEESLARMIMRIELKLENEAGLMESVTIYENEEAFTRLTFKDAVLNPTVDHTRFNSP